MRYHICKMGLVVDNNISQLCKAEEEMAEYLGASLTIAISFEILQRWLRIAYFVTEVKMGLFGKLQTGILFLQNLTLLTRLFWVLGLAPNFRIFFQSFCFFFTILIFTFLFYFIFFYCEDMLIFNIDLFSVAYNC